MKPPGNPDSIFESALTFCSVRYITLISDACVPVGQTPELLSEDDLKQRLYEIEKVTFFDLETCD